MRNVNGYGMWGGGWGELAPQPYADERQFQEGSQGGGRRPQQGAQMPSYRPSYGPQQGQPMNIPMMQPAIPSTPFAGPSYGGMQMWNLPEPEPMRHSPPMNAFGSYAQGPSQ